MLTVSTNILSFAFRSAENSNIVRSILCFYCCRIILIFTKHRAVKVGCCKRKAVIIVIITTIYLFYDMSRYLCCCIVGVGEYGNGTLLVAETVFIAPIKLRCYLAAVIANLNFKGSYFRQQSRSVVAFFRICTRVVGNTIVCLRRVNPMLVIIHLIYQVIPGSYLINVIFNGLEGYGMSKLTDFRCRIVCCCCNSLAPINILTSRSSGTYSCIVRHRHIKHIRMCGRTL